MQLRKEKDMINFDFKKNCYGCELCKNICPNNAIEMKENENGFLNPVVNMKKCVHCGLCERKCLFLNERPVEKIEESCQAYAAQINDRERLKKSSSGGFFYQVAIEFIKDGGYIAGCIWNAEMMPMHILSNKIEDIRKMQGSKYVQSDLANVFNDIKNVINEKKVLFIGTPCQVKAAKECINNENLYTISLICEGVPSRKVWKLHKESLEDAKKSKLIGVNFRNKENCGWKMPDSVYVFENSRKLKKLSFNLDYYVSSFIGGLIMNEKCYSCNFKGNNNQGDIVIGDFWKVPDELFGSETKDGISAVIVKTEKGNKMLNLLNNIHLIKVDMNLIVIGNPNLNNSIQRPLERESFFEKIDDININDNFRRCNKKLNSCKKKILKVLYDIKILKFLKK